MGFTFNADEVFQVAIDIERNGAAFYRRAVELQDDPAQKEFFEGLARMEDTHERTFKRMREELAGQEGGAAGYEPDSEAALYLQALANGHGGEGNPAEARSLTGNETVEDILRIGIGLEKNSILYYSGLLEMIPEKLGRDRVELIIAEERKHVAQLSRALSDFTD